MLISSTRHLIDCLFHQPAISLTVYFINYSFYQMFIKLVVFIYWSFYETIILLTEIITLLTGHETKWSFLYTTHFIYYPQHQIAIIYPLLTFHLISLALTFKLIYLSLHQVIFSSSILVYLWFIQKYHCIIG